MDEQSSSQPPPPEQRESTPPNGDVAKDDEGAYDSEELQSSIDQIEISKNEIDYVTQTATAKQSPLSAHRRSIKIPSCSATEVPFSIHGGADSCSLILVRTVFHPDLLNQLQNDDIILTADEIDLSGMVYGEASALLTQLFTKGSPLTIEVIPTGKITSDIKELLVDKRYPELQRIIRDNVYKKTVPYTTRPPRPGEVNGEHYNFVSIDTFLQLQKAGLFLEHGHFQGTVRDSEMKVKGRTPTSGDNGAGGQFRRAYVVRARIDCLGVVDFEHFYGTPRPDNEMMLHDSKGPLPPNWEIAYSERGEKYFIDHNTSTTQWEDPRELPPGWERVDDSEHGTFYVDHINKRTQYERPSTSVNAAVLNSHQSHHHATPSSAYQYAPSTATYAESNFRPPQSSSQARIPTKTPASIMKNPSDLHVASHHFTSDPNMLRGEMITAHIMKGPNGFGFTLIGNDHTSRDPEFIQIKSIIPNGSAALTNKLQPGDVLVCVGDKCMLGATQQDASKVFVSIPINEVVALQVCRGYPLIIDPSNKIVTENVYASTNTLINKSRDTVRIRITKGVNGFGFTITDSSQGHRVKKIVTPEQCTKLMVDDMILEVNGKNIRNMPHNEVVDLLKEFSVGQEVELLVSRGTPRHRSRTPTAAFRYGEQRSTPVPVLPPRSKTPAPHPPRPTKNGQMYRTYQPKYVPKTARPYNEDIYENLSEAMSNMKGLGFSSTPNYVPLAVYSQNNMSFVTVNLIAKNGGFGFRLFGGQETALPLSVGKIIPGGAAEIDARMLEGDELIEIDGVNVDGGSHEYAVSLIKKAATVGRVKIVLRRIKADVPRSTSFPIDASFPAMYASPPTVLDPYDVHLIRSEDEEFGCVISSPPHMYGSTIADIVPNSCAYRSGRLKKGDCVIAINGMPTLNMMHSEVVNMIKNSGRSVVFTIDPRGAVDRSYGPPVVSPHGMNMISETAYMPLPLAVGGHHRMSQNDFMDGPQPSELRATNIGNGYSLAQSRPVFPHPEQAKLIRLELPRGAKGFGFSIRGGVEFEDMPLFILRIAEDGPAAQDGRLCVGDQLVEINGQSTIYSKRRRMKRWMRRRNPPSVIHFQQDRYVAEIPEDAAVKDFVLKVTAQHNGNQPLYYSMVAPEDTRHGTLTKQIRSYRHNCRSFNTFTLDTSTGEIWLAKPLDREVLDTHVIKVTAYERLDPSVMASTTVVIDVLDVQDNMPMFERDSYFTEVREDAPIGTTVLSVFARDLDAGANGEVEYSITDDTGFFAINAKTGVLQTTRALDRENISMYRFQAIASDKGTPVMSSKAVLEINVVDVNDNAPQFEQVHYNITILETVDTPSVIAKLTAEDQDIGDNGKVHYSIVASSTNAFSIDYRSGELSVLRKPDPRFSPIMLVVRAKDSAQPALSSTATCSINIIDVNDHAPSFVASQRDVFIDEGVPVGSLCCSVLAVDEDTGKNGEVRYRFLNDVGDFKINPETGKIEVLRQLDRETNNRYVLQIIAEDGGDPPLNSTVNITIHIRDVNDNAPQFAQHEYNVTFPEDSPVGTEIIRLQASDADADAKLVYRLETDDRDIFALIDLGNEGAVINLAKSFHSNDMVVHLVLVATDEGGLQGRCKINIFIDDVNRPPYFLENPLSVRIPENSPIDFHVAKIRAMDNDRGANSEITYFIDLEEFRIDNETGLITVARKLDRELRSSYTLMVSVSDKADPPLVSTTILEVILEDENDNSPVFTSLNYTVSISEDIPVGTSFLQVTANDDDIGNNAIVDYYFEEDDEFVKMDLFRIDRSSGTVRVDSKLDRETTPRVILPVLARDRGDPSLVGRSVVTITLADVNDNAPQFQFPMYNLWVAENSPIGTTVGQLVANDLDEGENARISFRIFGGNDAKLFGIETDPSKNGVVNIVTRSEFDCEAKIRQFHIELQAISGQLSATVPVTVFISDENDNKPQIRDFNIITVTFENEEGRNEIASIPAFDPDINATLEYFIVENDILNVDKSSGMLSFKYTLERNLNMPFKAGVSDGPNTACARARLMNIFMNDEDLRNSVTVRIDDTDVEDFLDLSTFDKFVEAISIAANTNASNVYVFSVQEAHDAVNISFFVYRANKPISSWKLEEILTEQRRNISETIDREVQMVRDNMCVDEPCQYYQRCRQTLKYTRNHEHFSTDNFIMHGLRTTKTFYCECPRGFTSADITQGRCDRRLDLCFSSPCQNNGTCTSLENDYKCDCPREYTGQNCEQSIFVDTCIPSTCKSGSVPFLNKRRQECRFCPWNENDRDEYCNLRSVSFDGDGYITLTKVPSRLEWTMELSIATITSNGVLAFAGSREHDFIELFLSGGLPKMELSLGGDIYTVEIEDWRENRINDGEWHTVRVKYFEHTVQLIVDDCDEHISLNLGVTTGYRRCASKTELDLPARCKDMSLPCDRFLDLASPLYIGGKPNRDTRGVINGYSGCIRDVNLDGSILNFGDFSSLEMRGSVTAGCKERHDFCSKNPCPEKSQCVNKWNGFHCACHNRIHSQKPCDRIDAHMPSLLLKEASYAHFQTPPKLSYPFQLLFEFRTREKINQIMVLEFEIKSQIFIFSLESGLAVVQIDSERYLLPYPYLADGGWHGVTVDFQMDYVNVTLDYIYDRKLPVYGIAKLSQLDKVYTGIAPSTNHPSSFVGCLRNVEITNHPLKITTHSGVKPGCGVENQCQIAGICPKKSTCVRKWDRHICRCDRGFVGDTCTDFCALNGICANNGTCVKSSSGKGYECLCAEGFRGANCEMKAPLRYCPEGWFGEWPQCMRCQCDQRMGFSGRCNKASGECQCKSGSYLKNGMCVPCDCGYGSVGKSCNSLGQCRCSGEAKGLRCDRCLDSSLHLDPKTHKCRRIPGRCPSNIESGIQWPSTMFGMMSRQSCRKGEVGFASRTCSSEGVWDMPTTENCSLSEVQTLYDMTVKKQDNVQIARRLANTTSYVQLTGKSVITASTVLSNLIKSELDADFPKLGHIRDSKFVNNIVVSTSQLIKKLPSVRFLELSSLLFDYGRKLALAHQRMPFLQPIAVSADNLMYIVDDIVSPTIELPVFSDSHKNQIRLPELQKESVPVFYFIVQSHHCIACGSYLVGVFGAPMPVRVAFSLGDRNSWSYQECAILANSDQPKWSVSDAKLTGLNDTHAICEFSADGVYSVLSKPDSGVFLKLSSVYRIPYFAPASGIFSLFLCTVSFITTVFKTTLDTKVSRLCVIMSFILNATATIFTTHVELNMVFCPVRNAVISFCSSTLFAWTFLYSWSVYKIIAKTCHYHQKRSRFGVAFDLFVGLIIPISITISVFVLSESCMISPKDLIFLLFVGPIAILVLLSFYSSATSLMVALTDMHAPKAYIARSIFLHWFLMALFCVFNVLGLGMAFKFFYGPLLEVILNLVLMFSAIAIFLWSTYFTETIHVQRSKHVELWVEDSAKPDLDESAYHCDTPLLQTSCQDVSIDSTDNPHHHITHPHWMPDVIPPTAETRSVPLAAAHILSSPQKALLLDSQHYALSSPSSTLRKNYESPYGTLEDNDVEDAYYTYSATRYKTPSSTFKR
ncbi:hypothetical protein QR680_002721 [Steinernema hermaphroditum]|uniref:Uncharacterized protein n=1 Tax=Steinernema hermaphroditum TaxID=289476 RepID=A0AA39H5K1_9BILA|nr:hypothetical protein QR680_002721 [Steinernema hermaphroditum]